MRLFPRTLAGQTVLILLLGVAASHLASMVTFSHERGEAVTAINDRGVAARIAEITRLVEESPAEWRHGLLRAANGTGMRVRLVQGDREPDRPERTHEAFVRLYLASQLGARPLDVRMIEPENAATVSHDHADVPAETWPSGHALDVTIRLKDGDRLNFQAAVPDVAGLWSSDAVLSMALMTVGVLVVSFWAVRRLTRPLAIFAQAAERLGKDVQAPPLPLTGPTELQQAAQAFNQMQERLRRLIEARMQMLAAISHDLRTPITLMKLRTEFVDDEENRSKMLATLDEMETMVSSILSFAREDALQEGNRVVDVGALVASLCDDLTDAGLDVQCAPPPKVPYQCRPLALKRALLNLVQNAVKYGARARVAMTADETSLSLVVDDDGPGIPAEELARVFTPFYRVEGSRCPETGGVGLGLSVAAAIVHAHGGEITLANRPGGGLRAEVRLPR